MQRFYQFPVTRSIFVEKSSQRAYAYACSIPRMQQGSSPSSAPLVPESGLPKLFGKKRGRMRSELIYSAITQIPNRFLLSTVAIMATRKLHLNSTRVEETANQVFTAVSNGSYVQVK